MAQAQSEPKLEVLPISSLHAAVNHRRFRIDQ